MKNKIIKNNTGENKNKDRDGNLKAVDSVEMLPITTSIPKNPSASSLSIPRPNIINVPKPSSSSEDLIKVSDWHDTDSCKTFMSSVKSGDIVESRNSRTSHWGIALRIKQPPSPNGKQSKRQEPDEIMIYHLIHAPTHRGQVGQFTIDEFWKPDCRIRINNTTNGMCLYGKSPTIPKRDVLDNAVTAHMSTTLKWQTCSDFIRWTCETGHHHTNYNVLSKSQQVVF